MGVPRPLARNIEEGREHKVKKYIGASRKEFC